jgi:hypothetical protein
VLGEFFVEMQEAHQQGRVPADPSVPMAQSFYDTIKAKSEDGYNQLRYSAARDLLTEMYAIAADSGDKNLALSASHIASALAGVNPAGLKRDELQRAVRERGFPFHHVEELPQLKPQAVSREAKLQAENEALRQKAQRRLWNRCGCTVRQLVLADESSRESNSPGRCR